MDKYQQDAADRRLRELFVHVPIADGGFSDKVCRRLKRDSRKRQFLVLTAALAGALISMKPLLYMLQIFGRQSSSIMEAWLTQLASLQIAPESFAMPLVFALLVTVLVALRIIED